MRADLADERDDLMAIDVNSGMEFEQVNSAPDALRACCLLEKSKMPFGERDKQE